MPVQFRQYFKEIAEAETRSIRIFDGHESGLPAGEYGFVEMYCDEPNCDCRRVHLLVVADWSDKPLAMIGYGWEPPAYYIKWMHGIDDEMAADMSGVSLEPFFDQSKYAEGAKKLCEHVLLCDTRYVERLKRHYRMMRDYVDQHGSSDGTTFSSGTIRNTAPRVGRNDPCPCGSGKKYKKCCGQ